MKILQVIHGYPPLYNAGSENYTRTLCHQLIKNHEVHVFSREENSFIPAYEIRSISDATEPQIVIHLINNPNNRDRYWDEGISNQFAGLLKQIKPDIIHIGHLNHLSLSIVKIAALFNTPIIYTVHDFWLFCPRGQFLKINCKDPKELWALCEGQENRKCAEQCYSRYFGGSQDEWESDVIYWTEWINRRMKHTKEIIKLIDLFLIPSYYMYQQFRDVMLVPEQKLKLLSYGFNLEYLNGRNRQRNGPFIFGYIGTHTPAKGIHHLIKAFSTISGNALLRIWGRTNFQTTSSLKTLIQELPPLVQNRIEMLPEYCNPEIIKDVFNKVDAIVVPSIWMENSPLVIHEALQARVPVITADIGGMKELIQNEKNGLCYKHRDYIDLASKMQRFIDDPDLAYMYGTKGYLQSMSGDIPNIKGHVKNIESAYSEVLHHRYNSCVERLPFPWRITFDTNPGLCNLHCIMCEVHSLYNKQKPDTNNIKNYRTMPIQLIRQVISQSVSLGLKEIIPSTMGEPLLYENFDDILDLCREYNIKLNLTTNGTFPRKPLNKWKELLLPVASDIKISFNGFTKITQESIMVGSCFSEVIDNIKEIIAYRNQYYIKSGNFCRITLQLTFMEMNLIELPDIVRLAIDLGIDRVKGHHVWVTNEFMKNQSLIDDPQLSSRWNNIIRNIFEIVKNKLLPNGNNIKLENFSLIDGCDLNMGRFKGKCPFLGQEAWIDVDGNFSPCCAPNDKRSSLGSFGNLNETKLSEIWNSPNYRILVNTYRNNDLCLKCIMRRHGNQL